MNKLCKILVGSLLCLSIVVGIMYYRAMDERHAKEWQVNDVVTEQDIIDSANSDLKNQDTENITQDESETQAETEEEPLPEVKSITISAVGDCALGPVHTKGYEGSFYEYYDNYGEDYFFEGVRDIFSTDDFTIVNLECVLTNETERVEKTWNIKGYPEYTGILLSGAIEGCGLANNHTFDYGEASHTDTENALDEAQIAYAFNEKTLLYTTENGINIGVVSANLLSKSEQDENYVRDGIASLRQEGADIVIACCHWGVETKHYANEYQRETAHKIIDWGADLLIGAHPHVLQGVEVYNGKVICYSLGNFCFGANSNPSDKDTAIFQQTFTFIDGVLQPDVTAGIIPCRISSVTNKNDYCPTVLDGDERQDIIDKMNAYSQDYEEKTFDDEGTIIVEECNPETENVIDEDDNTEVENGIGDAGSIDDERGMVDESCFV